MTVTEKSINFSKLATQIKTWGLELGFDQVGITDIDLTVAEKRLKTWLQKQYHGEMDYMQRYGTKRARPHELVPGTLRVIAVRMNYLPPNAKFATLLKNLHLAFISRYALGRDYHKLIRKRLEKLAQKIQNETGPFNYRAFTDSAPVMEKPLAEKAGIGFMGKHTNLIHTKAGSWFFLGVLYTDLPLPIDKPATAHCGSCFACKTICPTGAIKGPYELDARRCISYLTIELKGSIPEELRNLIGNRIYGCDDCQLVCPWNKFAKVTPINDFHSRHRLDDITLVELFTWTKEEFLHKTQGSAIRRIGYERWLRNIAVALGNAPKQDCIINALYNKKDHASPLVREHVLWALEQQKSK